MGRQEAEEEEDADLAQLMFDGQQEQQEAEEEEEDADALAAYHVRASALSPPSRAESVRDAGLHVLGRRPRHTTRICRRRARPWKRREVSLKWGCITVYASALRGVCLQGCVL